MSVEQINTVLSSFKIKATCESYHKVRNISIYDLRLAIGGRVRDVEKYSQEIAMAMRSKSLPLIKVHPELGVVRVQLVDDEPQKVDFIARFREQQRPKGILPFYMGESIDGEPLWVDFHTNPHLLIAGATGSGKSTLLHSIVGNALSFPSEKLEIMLVDTKQVEFTPYLQLNRKCLTVDTSYHQFLSRLEFLYAEMEARYQFMKITKMSGNYYSDPSCPAPYTIVIVDEFADLIMQDQNGRMQHLICKIAQKGRAAGIHLVIATQRPSVDVFSGSIKANFPARISCRVSSRVDSQVILDVPGGQNLLGRGDALIKTDRLDLVRFQAAFATPNSIMNG